MNQKKYAKRKLAFKEEVAKAQNFLENAKSKYYDEIKLRPGVTQEQQKAMDFSTAITKSSKKLKNYTKRLNVKLTNYSMKISKVLILKLEIKDISITYRIVKKLLKTSQILTI